MSKTVELRRVYPKLNVDDIVVIYESSPEKKITGYFVIGKIESLALTNLWEIAKINGQISKKAFDSYFSQKQYGLAIYIKEVQKFKAAYCLKSILPGVKAP